MRNGVMISFDYALIADKDDRGKLECLERDVRKRKHRVADDLCEIGKTLATARDLKACHKGGVFGAWCQWVGFSKTQAYRYIQVFETFGDVSSRSNLERLQDSALYALSEPETPKEAVKEALKLADQGKIVTHKNAKEIIAKHKPPVVIPKTHLEDPVLVDPLSQLTGCVKAIAQVRREIDDVVEKTHKHPLADPVQTDLGNAIGNLKKWIKEPDMKPDSEPVKPPAPTKRVSFQAPSVDEVREYCKERGNKIDPETFVDHYTANGWKVGGKGAMKDWRASVRTWERNERNNNGSANTKRTDHVGPGQRYRP